MGRIEQMKELEADEEVTGILEDIRTTFGLDFTPNFFMSISKNSTALKGIFGMYKGIIFSGDLAYNIKELIFLTIALKQKCQYCTSIHLAINNQINKSEMTTLLEDVHAIKNKSLKTVLLFAVKCANETKQLTDQDFQDLYDLEFSKEQVMEIIAMASLASNAINITKAMDIKDDIKVTEYLAENKIGVNF